MLRRCADRPISALAKSHSRLHKCTFRAHCLKKPFPSRNLSSRQSPKDESRVVFSGIQPTGVPHLGNYLGALRQWVQMQNQAPPSTRLMFSIVDLHSLTARQPATFRRQARREVLAAFLAVGLDPDRSTIFYQSDVPAHSELHWILSCDANMGQLSRMTQWKSKLSGDDTAATSSLNLDYENSESLRLGLFSYPVLQAADVLIHGTTHVPVGQDQQQHIEFARNVAVRFNNSYGNGAQILALPEVVLSPFKRVMSLTKPHKKMSKSDESAWSRIMLNDSPEEVTKKIKKAVTDSLPGISYDPIERPGVSNLIDIISHLEDKEQRDVVEEFQGSTNLRFLKERTTRCAIERLSPIREKFETLMSDSRGTVLDDIARKGAAKANSSAMVTMKRVRDAIGI